MSEERTCSECGCGLSGGGEVQGLCAACLMTQGLLGGENLHKLDPQEKNRVRLLNCPDCHRMIEMHGLTQKVDCPYCGKKFKVIQKKSMADLPIEKSGRFKLIEILGSGGFGKVWKARDLELDRFVALKIPKKGQLTQMHEEERFLREARAAASLHHSGIVPIYEVNRVDGYPFIVYEYIEGISLGEHLKNNGVSYAQGAWIVAKVADALDYSHSKKVIHRDLKPENIMLDQNTKPQADSPSTQEFSENKIFSDSWSKEIAELEVLPRIMDFGMAKRDSGDPLITLEGNFMGTPAYMSPEQIRSAHVVDERGDIYSLGIILYEILTGELPFRGAVRMVVSQVLSEEPRAPRIINDSIPRDLETIAMKCIAKEASRRYQRASDVAADLRHWLRGEPIEASPVSRVVKIYYWSKRNPLSATLGSGLIVTMVLAFIIITGLWVRAEKNFGDAGENLEQARVQKLKALRNLESMMVQRRLAEKNFRQARNAVDELIAFINNPDLGDTPELDLLKKEMLDKALKYYSLFITQKNDDPSLQADLAKAYSQKAFITSEVDEGSEAIELYNTALSLLDKNIADNPKVQDSHTLLAHILMKKADLSRNLGDREGAMVSLMKARSTLVSLSALSKKGDVQISLADLYDQLGDLQGEMGQKVLGLRNLEKAEQILKKVFYWPEDHRFKSRMGSLYRHRARIRHQMGQDELSKKAYESALRSIDKAATLLPKRKSYKVLLAQTYYEFAMSLFEVEEQGAALGFCFKALDIQNQLFLKQPLNPSYKKALARTSGLQGAIFNEQGSFQKAESALRSSLNHYEGLVPLSRDFYEVSKTLQRLGKSYYGLGQYHEALSLSVKSKSYLRDLIEADLSDSKALLLMAKVSEQLHLIHIKMNHQKEAIQNLEQSVDTQILLLKNLSSDSEQKVVLKNKVLDLLKLYQKEKLYSKAYGRLEQMGFLDKKNTHSLDVLRELTVMAKKMQREIPLTKENSRMANSMLNSVKQNLEAWSESSEFNPELLKQTPSLFSMLSHEGLKKFSPQGQPVSTANVSGVEKATIGYRILRKEMDQGRKVFLSESILRLEGIRQVFLKDKNLSPSSLALLGEIQSLFYWNFRLASQQTKKMVLKKIVLRQGKKVKDYYYEHIRGLETFESVYPKAYRVNFIQSLWLEYFSPTAPATESLLKRSLRHYKQYLLVQEEGVENLLKEIPKAKSYLDAKRYGRLIPFLKEGLSSLAENEESLPIRKRLLKELSCKEAVMKRLMTLKLKGIESRELVKGMTGFVTRVDRDGVQMGVGHVSWSAIEEENIFNLLDKLIVKNSSSDMIIRGVIYLKAGHYVKSQEALKKLLSKNPKYLREYSFFLEEGEYGIRKKQVN